MNNIRIRRAVRKDCPRLMELIRELAEYERAPHEVTVSAEHFEQSGFGENPVWWAFVAVTGADENTTIPNKKNHIDKREEIIGFALYYIRYSTWKGQMMYLEDIIVTEKARGKGIGKLLFDELIAEAKQKGFKRITWQVLNWNEPAIRFYEKLNARFDAEWVNGYLDL
ncbi:MAG: GNAT family N-acetyltransferase [Chitinophagaceae bacterium]|nr:GNAT family N-acetyltransferase [Chitinophagaceae bacterium]